MEDIITDPIIEVVIVRDRPTITPLLLFLDVAMNPYSINRNCNAYWFHAHKMKPAHAEANDNGFT